ncbi:hypothetical protein F4778DRAFT_742738 [Xylariomycetidae sp. FL2044]|nr:hypothetical protein F4778DRAFT_742738 [Xylariomycetidae sp. FL2044]
MFNRRFFSSSKSRRISDTQLAAGSTTPSGPTTDHIDRSKSPGADSDQTLFSEEDRESSSFRKGSLQSQHQRQSDTSLRQATLSVRSKSRPLERKDDPLGLTLIHTPKGDPSADIIFIHGLGGSSRLTWSKDHDLELCWPLKWLPSDPDVGRSRIFTFGYNAEFRSASQSSVLGISDFAKNLLFDMLYGRNGEGHSFNLGQSPLIFVTHSMGGLVFKKAYLDAQLDSRYSDISQSIKAVVFLSTPHRGSDLSELLNRLLSVSFRTTPKQYVTELGKHGSFLKNVNEQFRHIAPSLQIFSFYETLQTSLGLSSTMILDEDTAKLGYPGEISRSLDADHHGVCKFASVNDPNYRAVLGALKALVSTRSEQDIRSTQEELEIVRTLLSLSDNTEHDLNYFLSRKAENTCEWILEQPHVRSWTCTPLSHELLWVHGRPGRGKSVMAAFLVEHLRDKGAHVQYFFFRGGDETKRSVSSLLRSLAFQLARQVPAFRKSLVDLAEGSYKPKEADWKSTWKKVFLNLLFKMDFCPPLYWVIDALDESNSAQQTLELLGDIRESGTPIHVIVISRPSPNLSTSFGRIGAKVHLSTVSIDGDLTDMRIYVEEELQYLGWDPVVKDKVISRILEQAHDNFLWVYLILEEIKECNTDEDVRDALDELPPGMDALYQRMVDSIAAIRRPSDRNLSRQLLVWAMYARRSVSIIELSALVEQDFGHILDIASTVNRLCGQFVVIEGQDQIGLVHQTARDYLISSERLPFSLDSVAANREILEKSISVFMDKTLRSKVSSGGSKFLHYRATSWYHHLRTVSYADDSDEQLDTLIKFFRESSVLIWIQVLASLGQLHVLIETSRRLTIFVKRKRNFDVTREPSFRRFEDLEFIESWSRDLLKIPGRFGSSLSQDPESIHHGIVPFCPQSSAIYQTFVKDFSSLRVKGLSDDWDDCLARVSVGSEHQATLLSCSYRYLAVVDSTGIISTFDCTTFHRVTTMDHGESILSICFSSNGDRIATYGPRTTKIWSSQSGLLLNTINNSPDMQAMCLSFVKDDTQLMAGTDRRCVLEATLGSKGSWSTVDPLLLNDIEALEGTYLNSPAALAISPDNTKIAAAYRRFPMTIWSIRPARVLTRVNRDSRHARTSSASPFVRQISWHPGSEELMGLFEDGYLFRLNILEGTYQEQAPDTAQWPWDIHISPDGSVYAIRGVQGTIKLYDYQTFTLIYQLTSDDMTPAFCFSPDGRRFLDIRGSSCNIWEPNALVRLSAEDDNPASSQAPEESIEQSNYASETFADNPTSVHLLSFMSSKSVAAIGDDEGTIALLDYSTARRVEIGRTATGIGVEQMAWSKDDTRLTYAEVGGRITVLSIASTPSGWEHRRLARFKANKESGGIMQLLLSPDSKMVLVVFRKAVQVWALEPVSYRGGPSSGITPETAKWILHPSSQEYVLSVTPTICVVYAWTDMSEVSRWDLATASSLPQVSLSDKTTGANTNPGDLAERHPEAKESAEKATLTHCKGLILLQISRRISSASIRSRFTLFDGLVDTDDTNDSTIAAVRDIPPDVLEQIEVPLNVLRNERLVFLDRSLRVCTWHLKSTRGYSAVKRHFFIPRDWISDDNVGLLDITPSGAILCPRKSGVAVIESTIGSEW